MDNLKAEMQRNGLTVRDIMRTIGCSEKTARNKINGETDFTYPEADISKEGNILDFAVENNIIKKSGAWFSYNGEKIGQGRDNVRKYMVEN